MMTNEEKAQHWLKGAKADLEFAEKILNDKWVLNAGYFCHLAVEKTLKFAITKQGLEFSKIHQLGKLAKEAMIYDELADEQKQLLLELTPLQIEARYPEYKRSVSDILTFEMCKEYITKSKEFLEWVQTKLNNQ